MKKVYFLRVIVLLVISLAHSCQKDEPLIFAGGNGTKDDPYVIETPKQLDAIRHNLDKHFVLAANIDLSTYTTGEGWVPIGDDENPFSGTLLGNGYTISNLTINLTNVNNVGLFGKTNNAGFKSIELIDVNIVGGSYVGGLVGYNIHGHIINSFTTGNISGLDYVGGIVGWQHYGSISKSYSSGTINGMNSIGGIVGLNNVGVITHCYATGSIFSEVNSAGGLIGFNSWGIISYCYALGDVAGNHTVGGFVGMNGGDINYCYAFGNVQGVDNVGGFAGSLFWDLGSIQIRIRNSYATGDVLGSSYVGGFIGFQNGGNIINAYAVGSVSGDEDVGGFNGGNRYGTYEYCYYNTETSGQNDTDKGIPKTTAEMMQQSTFETWDFVDVWGVNEGLSYPFLLWQEEK